MINYLIAATLLICAGAPVQPPSTRFPTETVTVRLSYYDPSLGPPNCNGDNWLGGKCLSRINNFRDPWWVWPDRGAACPVEFDIGTQFVLPPGVTGGSIKTGNGYSVWTCVDRGGSVTALSDGTYRLDLMRADYPRCKGCAKVTDDFCTSACNVVEVYVIR